MYKEWMLWSLELFDQCFIANIYTGPGRLLGPVGGNRLEFTFMARPEIGDALGAARGA